MFYFNPRTHVGCDSKSTTLPTPLEIFQSTHPRGVRPLITGKLLHLVNFNPRTHVGCDKVYPSHSKDVLHFNPRTHVGCDQGLNKLMVDIEISIHAPTWGATVAPFKIFTIKPISIHAPTWGATLKKRLRAERGEFQSTHPRGVRQSLPISFQGCFTFQSTHPRGVRL